MVRQTDEPKKDEMRIASEKPIHEIELQSRNVFYSISQNHNLFCVSKINEKEIKT